jgi:hypothetical protein
MTVDAVFKMNNDIESILDAQLKYFITELENTLHAAFPRRIGSLCFIGHDEQLELSEVVRQARDLSFNIQHGIVNCRLFVTAAPENSFGTYAFGLDRLSGSERTVLLKVKEITSAQIRNSQTN